EWTEMGEAVKTVATKAAQVWLGRDLEALGWYRGSGLVSALGQRFDTWADMTHTLATERAWRRALKKSVSDRAQSVAYFCGVLPEHEIKRAVDARKRVAADLRGMLAGGARPIWPSAFKGGTAGRFVIGESHVKANIEGSDRYALSLPGS